MFWNIARGMKRSASVKLFGRSSGVTSSCLAFEFVVTIFLLDQMSGRRQVIPALSTVSGCIAISSTAPHIPLGSCPT